MGVHGFRRTFGGRVVIRLDDVERGLLADVVSQLVELVAPEDDPWADADPLARMVGIDPAAERPDDPALARLFPDAYVDDDEASAEFRRFTERSLRDTKMQRAGAVLAALEAGGRSVEVAPQDAQAWLGVLNDLRLALGTRLGISEDNHDDYLELPDDHPAAMAFHIYDWLTFLQETLVQALSGMRSEPPPGAEDG